VGSRQWAVGSKQLAVYNINIRYRKLRIKGYLLIILIFFLGELIHAQSFNYWTRSFNEESSLLSGAVVGGGSGPSAIYYNPASISEITESKLSFHASLFSYRFYNVENALGDGNHLKWANLQIEPRFLSYMIHPKKNPDWSFELAFLNNENYKIDMASSVDKKIDILQSFPGEERYFSTFQYINRYRDDWIGIGGSWNVNRRLFIGASMFVTVKTNEYSYDLNIEAYPLDSIPGADYYSATYQEMAYFKYSDYRLIWKLGVMYKFNRVSLGATMTTPSLGGIYSDGKRVTRRQKQSNITSPETGEPIPNYFIGDYKERKDMEVNHKSPLSFALGLTWHSKKKDQVFYTTFEYFGGLQPYDIIQANEGPNISTGTVDENIEMNEWLSFVSGANPVFNAAFAYSWTINEKLLLMAGMRTDFNSIKGYNYDPYRESKAINGLAMDNYHLSGGLSWNVLGQDLITGIQYTIGRETGQKQIVNLTDPDEFNYNEMAALQGTRHNTMTSLINSLSLYVGATFNFGGGDK